MLSLNQVEVFKLVVAVATGLSNELMLPTSFKFQKCVSFIHCTIEPQSLPATGFYNQS